MTVDPLRIISVSGGKDSTALYLWAINQWGRHGFRAVFADTGHEHPVTLNYVRNLAEMAKGPSIEWVKADFADVLKAKGKEPSGNAFLDMMLWKGRAPSAMAQFCTEHVKLRPIRDWLERNRNGSDVEMYVGIRAGESSKRAKMPEREWSDFYDDTEIVRPLLRWTEEQVFAYLETHGVPPNPLYGHGSNRVGCYPCIHARKAELAGMPDWAWDKLAEWEKRLGRTWFSFGEVPLTTAQRTELAEIKSRIMSAVEDVMTGVPLEEDPYAELTDWKNRNSPSVAEAREWAKTSRGGRQFTIFGADTKDVPSCMSTWGVCE